MMRRKYPRHNVRVTSVNIKQRAYIAYVQQACSNERIQALIRDWPDVRVQSKLPPTPISVSLSYSNQVYKWKWIALYIFYEFSIEFRLLNMPEARVTRQHCSSDRFIRSAFPSTRLSVARQPIVDSIRNFCNSSWLPSTVDLSFIALRRIPLD